MSLLRGCTVIFLAILIRCSIAVVTIGFGEIDRREPESAHSLSIELSKSGANMEDITVVVTPITFDEFAQMNRVLPSDFDSIALLDPAEYEAAGKQDFVRSIIRHTFSSSSDNEEISVNITFIDDSVNEADEGFLLVIEIENVIPEASTDNITLTRDGIALVVLADDDSITIGFEEPQYTVHETDGVVDDQIYVSKYGIKSEQTLMVTLQSPLSNSANKGEDYNIPATIMLVLNPEDERLPVSVEIVDDLIPEEIENFQLFLAVNGSISQRALLVNQSSTVVNIADDDVVVVGFGQTDYTVSEKDETLEVCIEIIEPENIDILIFGRLFTMDGTAQERGDYGRLEEFIDLPTVDDQRMVCYNIPITNDKDNEPNEQFSIQLIPDASTPSNVQFLPNLISITIVDDDPVNECDVETDNCHTNAECIDTPDSFSCVCKNGFQGNGVDCNDINECSNRGSNSCHSDAVCTNTEGSYTCSCLSGFTGNGVSCVRNAPPDECTRNSDCHRYAATCVTSSSGNKCKCRTGYSGNGKQCSDVNECTTRSHLCSDKATCVNTRGSYFCKCNSGYRANGRYGCLDVNECRTYRHRCNRNAVCTNTIGSYTCSCRSGYIGNGFTCAVQRSPLGRVTQPSRSSSTRSGTSHSSSTSRSTSRSSTSRSSTSRSSTSRSSTSRSSSTRSSSSRSTSRSTRRRGR